MDNITIIIQDAPHGSEKAWDVLHYGFRFFMNEVKRHPHVRGEEL